MSPDARFMSGLSLILIPTIVYGGLTVLGIVSQQSLGVAGPRNLSTTQVSLYRAGHAHAGVLTLLAIIIQMAADDVALSGGVIWLIRVAAIAASILISGGFFAVAHLRSVRMILYAGALLLAATTLTVGIGLIRSR